MVGKRITITNATGLHARPAADLVAYVKGFNNRIYLRKGDKQINAASIIHILTLGAVKGTELEVLVEGENEEQVLQSVTTFIERLKG